MKMVLFSNVAVIHPVTLLRSGTPSWMSSSELHKFFCNGYGLDRLCEKLLVKESYNIQHDDDDDVTLFILVKYKYKMIQVEVKNNI